MVRPRVWKGLGSLDCSIFEHQMMLQIKLKFNWSQVNLSAILLNWSNDQEDFKVQKVRKKLIELLPKQVSSSLDHSKVYSMSS